jgi:predicted transposase YbfD/YdcC
MTAVAAVLARSFMTVSEWVADAPPQVLAALGVRFDPLTRQFQPPGEATIRRVLETVDAAALDTAVGSWLAVWVQAGGQGQGPGAPGSAVDGKSVRGTRHASRDGKAVHLLAALDQQAGAGLAQAAVDGKTNEITRFAPLLAPLALAGCVVTADALHTQREHAQFLVTKKDAHYILVVKKNQPTLHAQIKNLPWRQVPAAVRQHDGGHGREERRTCRPRPSPPGWPSRTPPRPSASPARSGPWLARSNGASSRSTPSPA